VKSKCVGGLLVLITILTGRIAFAQELSAEVVGRDTAGHVSTSKIYMSHGKVRVEPSEVAPGAFGKAIQLLDLDKGTCILLDPDRKTYMEQPPGVARRNVLQFKSPDNTPCTRNPNGSGAATCKQVGTEMINGRNAEKWELVDTIGAQTVTIHVWLDSRWHFIVKQEALGRTGEMQNIKEGPQPASLFEIPADYHKMTMHGSVQK
jgi:hypothetical protein